MLVSYQQNIMAVILYYLQNNGYYLQWNSRYDMYNMID